MQNTIQHVHQSDTYVWDTATLMWVPAQQALVKTDTLTVTGDVTDRAGRLLGHVTVDNFPATQPVSAVALPLPAGAATAARQDTANTSLGNLDVALSTRTKPADQQHVIVDSAASIAVTGPLTDTQLRASAVPMSLAVAPSTPVTNAGLTNLDVALSTRLKPADTLAGVTTVAAVTSITNLVAVTGPLTDTQLRATPVPVSGTVSATSSADVLDADGDAAYVNGNTGKNLTQTSEGRLRVAIAAKVSDERESYQDAQIRSLSLTTDGRLRVSTSPASIDLEFFGNEDDVIFGVPNLTETDVIRQFDTFSPWGI